MSIILRNLCAANNYSQPNIYTYNVSIHTDPDEVAVHISNHFDPINRAYLYNDGTCFRSMFR